MSEFRTPIKPKRGAVSIETPITIPPSPFLKQLGYGTGVSVYQMVRSPRVGKIRSPWAIKRISQQKDKRTLFGKRLQDEAKILKKLIHPNVVGFRCFTKMSDGRQCLAMESCEGSLGDRIEARRDEGLGPYCQANILKVGLDISKALDYIHIKMKLLHGDIKSFNVLINGDFDICKLCDFGVSLPLDENGNLDYKNTKETYVGTECWSAPEILNETSQVSSKADIFSFGLTLWEMLSLEPPHVGSINEDSTVDESVMIIDDSMDEDPSSFYGTRPALPDIDQGEFKDVLAIFFCTTEEAPRCRPSANHITLCIEDMLKTTK